MNFKGKRLMPTYLIDFLKDIYPGDIPANFGKRMVSRQLIAYIHQMYSLFGGKSIDNFGRDMCPEYLIKYLEYLINADYIEYEDDTVAYTKETPENALKYAFLNYVGGMSYKSVNIGNSEWISGDYNSTTGEYETADNYVCNNEYYCSVKADTTYTYTSTPSRPLYIHFYASDKSYLGHTSIVNSGSTFTTPNDCAYIRYNTTNGQTSTTNLVMINEGSTALPYEPYFEGIRESLVTSVNSLALKNNDDKYGWGINSSLYNVRDYNDNKGRQVVGKYTFKGDETISLVGGYTNIFYFELPMAAKTTTPNCLTSANDLTIYTTFNAMLYNNTSNSYICGSTSGTRLLFKLIDITDTTNALEYLTGKTFIYELATEVEEDIDPIDNVIDVSSGETTFNNEYEQDVPSSISYFIPNV